MYKLKYRGEVIFEDESLDEIKEFKEKYFKEKREFYFSFLSRINTLNSLKKNVLERDSLETDEKYIERLKENNSNFLEEFENLGKEYFKDNLKGYFFFNVPIGLFGFELTNGESIGLTELGGEVRRAIPSEKDFKIE